MSINPKSVEFHQCHAKRHSISKDNERDLCQGLLTIENTDRTWKCTRCIMQMSCLYASDFPFKHFWKLAQHAETIRKNVWEKSNDAYSSSIRVQTTINHIFYVFYDNINVKENVFFQSASWERHCATQWREQRGWDVVILYWFVLSMRMQVILDSSFARPGSAPIWGGKKVEFRDWTMRHFEINAQEELKIA